MNYNRYKLKSISGSELDSYLERGWYRMGLSIFTTHFLIFNDQLYNAVWLRLPLFDYQPRKSLRKIKRKVDSRFTVKINKAIFNTEKEILFEKYKLNFKGDLYSSLRMYMLDNEYYNIYNTLECCVYDGDELIAFSYFDVGEKTMASILAAFNHNYSAYSLGMYTMIEEINYAREMGLSYYYPGYFVPNYGRFDYKCRIGETEYYDYFTKKWQPTKTFNESKDIAVQLKNRIFDIYTRVSERGLNAFIIFYRNWELGDFNPSEGTIYNQPLFLSCEYNDLYFVIEYDLIRKYYRLSLLKKPEFFRFNRNELTFENTTILNIYNLLECDLLMLISANFNDILSYLLSEKQEVVQV